jgi:hypothetical protein
MRLPGKLGSLLAAAMMAAGVTAAAALARASTPSPYWEIITLQSADGVLNECLQGDFGGSMGTSVTQHYCDPTFTNANQQ